MTGAPELGRSVTTSLHVPSDVTHRHTRVLCVLGQRLGTLYTSEQIRPSIWALEIQAHFPDRVCGVLASVQEMCSQAMDGAHCLHGFCWALCFSATEMLKQSHRSSPRVALFLEIPGQSRCGKSFRLWEIPLNNLRISGN